MKTDTPMRTVTGWKFFGDLTVGDRLYDDRGLPCTVTDVTPARIPPLMFRLRYGNGTVLFVEGEQPLTCVHRETYYRWKKHREREEISDYYPADWVTALAEEETTEGLYDQVIAEGARPEQISWTQWMTQSPIMRLVPIAPPFEGITHPDLPDDAYQTGIDLISMAKDQALAPVNYIPREILNAPPAYREDVLRGLLRRRDLRLVDRLEDLLHQPVGRHLVGQCLQLARPGRAVRRGVGRPRRRHRGAARRPAPR